MVFASGNFYKQKYVSVASVLLLTLLISSISTLVSRDSNLAISTVEGNSIAVSQERQNRSISHHPPGLALPYTVDNQWWADTRQQLKAQRYNITRQVNTLLPNGQSAWVAPNLTRPYVSYFTELGIQVVSRINKQQNTQPWQFGMRLRSLGRKQIAGNAKLIVKDNRIEYHYGSAIEWYINKREGIEHGFTLLEPNSSDRQSTVIELALSGNTKAHINDKETIVISSSGGEKVLAYGKLIAHDAIGNSLTANMHLSDNTISIVIDTQSAVYPVTIDPLLMDPTATDDCSTPVVWCALGGNSNDEFGWSVASAGDINNDGYDDVIVGDPYYYNASAGNLPIGRAYIYLGSYNGLSRIPNVILLSPLDLITTNIDDGEFGWSVASAGDVNGDGISDIIVGARWFDNPGNITDGGRAFVYYGTGSGNGINANTTVSITDSSTVPATTVNVDATTIYDWYAQSSVDFDALGSSVAGAGDINGDSFDDIIIGIPEFDNSFGSNVGAAYVYYGSATGLKLLDPIGQPKLAAAPDWTVEAQVADSWVGWAVASAGDVNGDNFSDIILSAHYYDTQASGSATVYTDGGRALVFHGSATGLTSTLDPNSEFSKKPDWIAERYLNASHFGESVASAGDVNGDGFGDVVIGAHWDDIGTTAEGIVRVYHGSASGLNINATTGFGEANTMINSGLFDIGFGWRVAGAGDVNADGYDDVIASSALYPSTAVKNGKIFLYQGSPTGISTVPQWTATTSQASAILGQDIGGVGDVNGDGYSDIGAGAYDFTGTGYLGLTGTVGAAFVYNGAGSSDITLSIAQPATTVAPNTPFTYTLTIKNSGPDIANRLVLTDTLAPEIDTQSVLVSGPLDWNCGVNTGTPATVSCPMLNDSTTNISLPASSTQSIDVSITVTALTTGSIINNASITGNIVAPGSTTNEASVVSASNTTIVNSQPVANDMVLATNEDTDILNQLFDMSDPNLAVTIVTQPANGALTVNAGGTFDYHPNQDYNNTPTTPDTFQYKATDQFGVETAIATVSITVNPVNDPPTADPYNFSISQGETYSADGIANPKLTGSDIETPAASLVFNAQTLILPDSGNSVTISADGSFTMTATNTAPTGNETFTFTVSDNDATNPLQSPPATVSISYLAGNSPPIAVSNGAPYPETNEGTISAILQLSASDPDGTVTEYLVDTPPTNGTLNLNNATGAFTYTPTGDFFGTDTFQFHAVDNNTPTASSNIAMFTISVLPINDPPTAAPVSFSVDEDSTNNPAVKLLGQDVDSTKLTYYLDSNTPYTKGLPIITGDTIQYEPYPNEFGTDTFAYYVTDESLATSNMATITVTINPVNDAPQIPVNPVIVETNEDQNAVILLSATDPENNALTFSAGPASPQHGTLSVTNASTGEMLYQPAADFNGTDSFSYTVADNGSPSQSVEGTVNITILPINDAPSATDIAGGSIEEDSTTGLSISISATDPDLSDTLPDSLAYNISTTGVDGPQKGNLTITNMANNVATVRYDPKPNESGTDSFKFTAVDNAQVASTAIVTVNISPLNDPPVIGTINTQQVFEGTATDINISQAVTDIDSEPSLSTLTYSIFTQPSKGSVAFKLNPAGAKTGVFVYTPNTGSTGADSFEFSVTDGQISIPISATVNININAVQDAPIATDLTPPSIAEDANLTANFVATDTNGVQDIVEYQIVTGFEPQHGTVTINPNLDDISKFTYTPNSDYFGADEFQYVAIDSSSLRSNQATVSITISSVNDVPEAQNDSVSFSEFGGSGMLDAIDADVGDTLTFSSDPSLVPKIGSVTIANSSSEPNRGTFTYSPNGKFGNDKFGFIVNDGNGGIAHGIISVTISKEGSPPPTNPTLEFPENDALSINYDDVLFQWSRVRVNGLLRSSIDYQLLYCKDVNLTVSCNTAVIPKESINQAAIKIPTFATLGTSISGLVLVGLLGSATGRRRFKHSLLLIGFALVLVACNDAVNQVEPGIITQPEPVVTSVNYSIQGLDPDSQYYWQVTATDTSTGLFARSEIHNFTTMP